MAVTSRVGRKCKRVLFFRRHGLRKYRLTQYRNIKALLKGFGAKLRRQYHDRRR